MNTHGTRVGCSVCVSCSVCAQDVVVWVTLGVQHVPKREDVPSVTTTGTTLRFLLLPTTTSRGTLTTRRATRV